MTRLFLTLVGTIFTVVLFMALTLFLAYRSFDDQPKRLIPPQTLDAWADEAIKGLPLGKRGLNDRLNAMGETVNVSMTLIMPDGEQFGRPVSARVVQAMRNELTDVLSKGLRRDNTINWQMGNRTHALRLIEFGGNYIGFLVSWTDPQAAAAPVRIWWVATIAGIALASIVLAWKIESPIRVLQSTAKAIASGDLSARPPQSIIERKDAIGDLGRTMGRMGREIDDLVANQRQLIRDISHELRTPLARIQVAIALINKKGSEVMIPRIEDELEKLDGLIGEVLALARMESGQSDMHQQRVDLADLLGSIAEDACFEFKPRRALLDIQSNHEINGDAEWLQRAIENIVRNAFKYSQQGDVLLSLFQRGDKIMISVADRGPGVPETELDTLFKPFTRGDSARSHGNQDEGGYGVGLAITRSVIRSHNGEVQALPREGGGLIVEVSLPSTQKQGLSQLS